MDAALVEVIALVVALSVICFAVFFAYSFITRFKIAFYLMRNVGKWVPFADIQIGTRATKRILTRELMMYVEKDALTYRRNEKAIESLEQIERELLKTAEVNLQTAVYFEYRVIVRKPVRKKMRIKDLFKMPGIATARTGPMIS